MRRIWAFITMVATLVLAVALLVQPISENVKLSNDYGSGVTLVYDITKRAEVAPAEGQTAPEILDLDRIDIKSLVMDRLDAAGVRSAEVTLLNPQDGTLSPSYPQTDTQSNAGGSQFQRLRVTLTSTTPEELENIKTVIGSTGTLSIADAENHVATGTDFFASETPAEVRYDAGKPYVLLHVKDASTWDSFKTQADGVQDTSLQKQVFLWRNFVSGVDSYAKAYPTDQNVAPDAMVKRKIVFRDTTDSIYSADDTALRFSSYKDADNATHEWTISSAKAMVASLNAKDYGFDIDLAYSDDAVAPTLGEDALRNTLIGLGVGYLVLFSVLIALYGWAGVVSLVSNSASLVLNVLILSLVGFEFSPAAAIGLVVSAILGTIINVNYFEHVRNEIAKGRDFLKANKEGYRKSFLLTLDLCAGSFLFALSTFLLSRDMTQVAMGVITIGAVLSFLVVNYLSKWMLYWLSTAASLDSKGKRHAFGLRSHKPGTPLYVVDAPSSIPSAERPDKSDKTLLRWSAIGVGALALFGVVGLGAVGGVKGGEGIFARAGAYRSQYRLDVMTTMTGYRDNNPDPIADGNTDRTYDFLTNTAENFTRFMRSYNLFGSDALAYVSTAYPGESFDSNQARIDRYLSDSGLDFQASQGTFRVVELQNDSQVLADEGSFSVVYASFSLDAIPSDGDGQNRMRTALDRLQTNFGSVVNDAQQITTPASTNIANATVFQNEALKNKYSAKYRISAGLSQSSAVEHYEAWFFAGLSLGFLLLSLYVFLRFGLSAFLAFFGVHLSAALFLLGFGAAISFSFSPLTAFGIASGVLLSSLFSIVFFDRNAELLRSLKLKKTATVQQRYALSSLSLKAGFRIDAILASGILSFAVFGMALFGTQGLVMMGTFAMFSLVGWSLLSSVCSLYVFYRSRIRFQKAQERAVERRSKRRNRVRKEIVADPDEAKETVVPGLNDYKAW